MTTSSLLYNATLASAAVTAAFEIGLLDHLQKHPEGLHLTTYASSHHLDYQSLQQMLFAMSCFDIVHHNEDTDMVTRGAQFEPLFAEKGYFLWMIKGYGSFLTHLKDLLPHGPAPYVRDGGMIALAGKDYGAFHVDPLVDALLQRTEWNKIADLGCGSANRLIHINKTFGKKALGVEINQDAIHVAKQAVSKAQLDQSIEIVQGDVCSLKECPAFQDVDLLTSFFMGHDLWPKERCIHIFRSLKTYFPHLKTFFFCDTFRLQSPPKPDIPTFSLGFELFHALMRQYIPTREEWLALFPEAGWKCIEEITTGLPATHLFVLTPIHDEL